VNLVDGEPPQDIDQIDSLENILDESEQTLLIAALIDRMSTFLARRLGLGLTVAAASTALDLVIDELDVRARIREERLLEDHFPKVRPRCDLD
jgi:hypothetical protein